jgi:CRP/FNR family transcriptional regulator, anaerobic regulatory protein
MAVETRQRATDAPLDTAFTCNVEAPPDTSGAGRHSSCSSCHLRTICLPRNLREDELAELDELTRVKRKVARRAALYRKGARFQSLYVVHSGSFKSVGTAGVQQQKVTGLYLPGDILGLDAISSQVHDYDAVALEDAEVCVVPYAALTRMTLRMPELQGQLLRALSGDIVRDHGLLLRLGAMSAEERVAAFLLGLSARYQKLGYAGTRFSVRMARHEIASYLGLTVETVCRLFTCLQQDGLVETRLREVELKDVSGLRKLVGY